MKGKTISSLVGLYWACILTMLQGFDNSMTASSAVAFLKLIPLYWKYFKTMIIVKSFCVGDDW